MSVVDVIVPDGLSDEPAPLVVVLHGYSGTADVQQQYFRFQDEAAARGAILAYPDGTPDRRDLQFWNATDACCNFFGSDVDDVARELVAEDAWNRAAGEHVRRVGGIQKVFQAKPQRGGGLPFQAKDLFQPGFLSLLFQEGDGGVFGSHPVHVFEPEHGRVLQGREF